MGNGMRELEPWYQLGYITPHTFVDTVPYQFYRLAPQGMMLVTANLDLADYALEAVERELPLFWRHVATLAKRKVNRIVLAGVPVTAALGRERVRALLDEVRDRVSIPADTDLEAIIAAMHHLGIERIAIGSRWYESLNTAVGDYLGLAGIEVVTRRASARSLAENEIHSHADGMRLAVELGRQALRASPGAQGLLLPGGLWIAIHAVRLLEAEFDKPVFLNLNSTLWAALRGSERRAEIEGWGKLLASL